MNTRANERLTTMSRRDEAVDTLTPAVRRSRIGRGRQALALFAPTSVLVGCGPDSSSDNNSSKEPSSPEQTRSATPSSSPTDSPSSNPETAVVSNLPSAFQEGPVWSDPRELLGKTPNIVIVTNDPEGVVISEDQKPTEVAGLSVETGEEVWSVPTAPPDDLDEADYAGARFLGESVVMAWTGTADGDSLEQSDEVSKLVFYNPETGEEIATKTVEGGGGLGRPVGLNGLTLGEGKVFTTNDEIAIDQTEYDAPGPVAAYNGGVVRGPIDSQFTTLSEHVPNLPGKFEREVDFGVRDDRVVRHLVMESDAQNYRHFYQVFDTEAMKPVAAPEECENYAGDDMQVVTSPSGVLAAVDQAVVNLETGDVQCLGGLSDSLDVTASVLADDGSLYGRAGEDRAFALDAGDGAKPKELDEGVNAPLAVFAEHVLFAADEDGVTVYERP